MSHLNTIVPKTDRRRLTDPHSRSPQEPKQRRMMIVALALLLIALGFVLYRDRDFWFPDTQEAEDQPQVQPSRPIASPAITGSGRQAEIRGAQAIAQHQGSAETGSADSGRSPPTHPLRPSP